MAVVVTIAPTSVNVTYKSITGSLVATATGATSPTYQWYKATSATSVTGATAVSAATTNSLTIPTNLTVGEAYYFCRVTDATVAYDSPIAAVDVIGVLPDSATVVTEADVLAYIDKCPPETQTRFADLCTRTGITFTTASTYACRSKQLDLFYLAL